MTKAMSEAASRQDKATDEHERAEPDAEGRAWLPLSLEALRLRIQRRILWLRAALAEDTLRGYGEQVISDARADWLLQSAGGSAQARFLRRDPAAEAIAARIDAAEVEAQSRRRELLEAGAPATIDIAARIFGLSPLEQAILMIALAPKVDAAFEQLYGYVHDRISLTHATPHLIEALLAPEADAFEVRQALLPDAPLRRFCLVQHQPLPGRSELGPLSPVTLDERMADFLRGISYLDPAVAEILDPAPPSLLADCHRPLLAPLLNTLQGDSRPAVNLIGEPRSGRRGFAAALAAETGMTLVQLRLDRLSTELPARLAQLRRIEREAALLRLAVIVDAAPADLPELHLAGVLEDVVERLEAFLIVLSAHPVSTDRPVRRLDIPRPDPVSRRSLWRQALGTAGAQDEAEIDALAEHFDFGSVDILKVAREAADPQGTGPEAAEPVPSRVLWQVSRRQSGFDLAELAQRIEPRNTWDDIVLPGPVTDRLKALAAQVAHRYRVYEEWGFGRRMSRGRGVSALFAGPSGTGKTLAAEVIAGDLELDLYRIDLAGVVSKYIGETEKNLRRIFDAAERSGAILFFDEADALFGKRSEVKDSHDRYANIEVAYLLQRMEEYRGLAILATNMKSHLDQAFLRRLRFVVNFPFPDSVMRRRIWEVSVPEAAPVESVDFDLLARLEISGGNIRNIVVNAAFLAAERGSGIRMQEIREAAQAEFEKIDRQLPLAELSERRP